MRFGMEYLSENGRQITVQNDSPLVSILVPCYNNQKFIYELLESIFKQTYRNIEVLIGDDASKDFNRNELEEWLKNNQSADIERVEIFESAVNLGTVANMERLHGQSRGEFLFNIAADDAFYDETVIECFIKRVDSIRDAGEEPLVIMAQLEMWDHKLKKKLSDFMTPESIRLVETGNPSEIFVESCLRCFLPAQFLYHKSILDMQGNLSAHYNLIEDWPAVLRMLRQNVKFHFMSEVPSAKHRDGGISHGNTRQSNRAFILYCLDLINCYYSEIVPYIDRLSESQRCRVLRSMMDITTTLLENQRQTYLDEQSNKQSNDQSKKLPNEQSGIISSDPISKKMVIKDMLKKTANTSVVLRSVFLMLLSYMCAALVWISKLVGYNFLSILLTFIGHGFFMLSACGIMIKVRRKIKRRI